MFNLYIRFEIESNDDSQYLLYYLQDKKLEVETINMSVILICCYNANQPLCNSLFNWRLESATMPQIERNERVIEYPYEFFGVHYE